MYLDLLTPEWRYDMWRVANRFAETLAPDALWLDRASCRAG